MEGTEMDTAKGSEGARDDTGSAFRRAHGITIINRRLIDSPLIRQPVPPVLPGERTICVAHKHWAILIWSIITALVALAAGVLLSISILDSARSKSNHVADSGLLPLESNTGRVLFSIWLVWGCILWYLFHRVLIWWSSYLVITDKRLILTNGSSWVHRCASVHISKVTSWSLRDSVGGRLFGYKSLVFRSDDDPKAVRTIERIGPAAARSIEEALPSAARNAYDEEAFKEWAPSGLRRFRWVVAALLFGLLVILGVAAATEPRIRTELGGQAQIIALLSIAITVITLIAPKR